MPCGLLPLSMCPSSAGGDQSRYVRADRLRVWPVRMDGIDLLFSGTAPGNIVADLLIHDANRHDPWLHRQLSAKLVSRSVRREARHVIEDFSSTQPLGFGRATRSGSLAIPQNRQSRIKRCDAAAHQVTSFHSMTRALVAFSSGIKCRPGEHALVAPATQGGGR